MSIIPGRYGGCGVRPPRPGSASRMVAPIPEGWKNTYARAEKALAEPFRGVTTEGNVVPGLFSLQKTGSRPHPPEAPLKSQEDVSFPPKSPNTAF